MGIIAADLFITLDGVYQAPGGRDEDRTDGFVFGGWQAPFRDELIGASIMSSIERTDALLLGRRTYDIFAGFWPLQAAVVAGGHELVLEVLGDLRRHVVVIHAVDEQERDGIVAGRVTLDERERVGGGPRLGARRRSPSRNPTT